MVKKKGDWNSNTILCHPCVDYARGFGYVIAQRLFDALLDK
jgi:hypothetical protein